MKFLSRRSGAHLPKVTTSFETGIRRLACVLVSISGLLGLAHLLSRYLTRQITSPNYTQQSWINFIDLNEEAALGAWYSAALWLLAAALAFALGLQSRQRGQPVWQWNGLAALFMFLSLDEGAALHEKIGNVLEDQLRLGGVFFWTWVLYGFVLVAAMAALFGKFLLTLPRKALWTFITAAAIFLTGALGFEMYGAAVASGDSQFLPGLGWSVSVLLEELLEMLGIIVAIVGLLNLLRDGGEIRFTTA